MLSTTGALVIALSSSAGTAYASEPVVNSNSSITVDYNTGQIIQGDNHDEELGIASISKIIVEYILFEEIESGNIEWDDIVEISDYAYQIGTDYRLSNIPLNQHDEYTVKDMYEALVLKSANAATIALAEKIEGSEPAFVDRMRKTIESFGVDDAKIYNTTGLPNKYMGNNIYPGSTSEDENSMSARSVAKIADRIVRDYPDILETSKIPSLLFGEGTDYAFWMNSTNQMLPGGSHERAGVDGLKTGTTGFAGRTFVGTAVENERRIITVVLNAKEDRFKETNKLMDYGFNEFKSVKINNKEPNNWRELSNYKPIQIPNGTSDELNYSLDREFELLINKDEELHKDYNFNIILKGNKDKVSNKIVAPIEKGQVIGYLEIAKKDNDLEYLNENIERKVPLVANEEVYEKNVFTKRWDTIVSAFGSLEQQVIERNPYQLINRTNY